MIPHVHSRSRLSTPHCDLCECGAVLILGRTEWLESTWEPRDIDALQRALLETVPTEYVDGRWVVSTGKEPQAVITYSLESSPETGHVGWCWWALGEMGDAPSYEAACRAAVTAVREVERRHSPRACRYLAKTKGGTTS